jgi:hypothetical protein
MEEVIFSHKLEHRTIPTELKGEITVIITRLNKRYVCKVRLRSSGKNIDFLAILKEVISNSK